MLNFKTIERLKPNSTIIDIIKCYDFKTRNGKVKILENTNLKFIEPTEYLILSPKKLTIYEYKVNEISNKQFYVKEHKVQFVLLTFIATVFVLFIILRRIKK